MTRTTRVEATFKLSLSIVARSKIDGNAENSSGLETFTDTMIMMRPIIIFTVKSISSAKLGSGTISIDMISKTITGIPRLAILVGLINCRKNDNIVVSIFFNKYRYLGFFFSCTQFDFHFVSNVAMIMPEIRKLLREGKVKCSSVDWIVDSGDWTFVGRQCL